MIAINMNGFVGGYKAMPSKEMTLESTVLDGVEKEPVVTVADANKDKPDDSSRDVLTVVDTSKSVVVPDSQGGVVIVRSDKQVFRKKILDFTEEYSRVLAVTFGVSAFLFNLGSTTVLNRRSVIWSGVAVVVVVIAFLIWHDRGKLFSAREVNNG